MLSLVIHGEKYITQNYDNQLHCELKILVVSNAFSKNMN